MLTLIGIAVNCISNVLLMYDLNKTIIRINQIFIYVFYFYIQAKNQ